MKKFHPLPSKRGVARKLWTVFYAALVLWVVVWLWWFS